MPSLSASVVIAVPPQTAYGYLQSRYDRDAHRSLSLQTKGYVPKVGCVEAEPNKRLVFDVRGRDPVLRSFVGSWKWTYEIQPAGQSGSQVNITYLWSWWMSLLGAGTTRHQASNEATGTAMALEALSWGRGEPCDATVRPNDN